MQRQRHSAVGAAPNTSPSGPLIPLPPARVSHPGHSLTGVRPCSDAFVGSRQPTRVLRPPAFPCSSSPLQPGHMSARGHPPHTTPVSHPHPTQMLSSLHSTCPNPTFSHEAPASPTPSTKPSLPPLAHGDCRQGTLRPVLHTVAPGESGAALSSSSSWARHRPGHTANARAPLRLLRDRGPRHGLHPSQQVLRDGPSGSQGRTACHREHPQADAERSFLLPRMTPSREWGGRGMCFRC